MKCFIKSWLWWGRWRRFWCFCDGVYSFFVWCFFLFDYVNVVVVLLGCIFELLVCLVFICGVVWYGLFLWRSVEMDGEEVDLGLDVWLLWRVLGVWGGILWRVVNCRLKLCLVIILKVLFWFLIRLLILWLFIFFFCYFLGLEFLFVGWGFLGVGFEGMCCIGVLSFGFGLVDGVCGVGVYYFGYLWGGNWLWKVESLLSVFRFWVGRRLGLGVIFVWCWIVCVRWGSLNFVWLFGVRNLMCVSLYVLV